MNLKTKKKETKETGNSNKNKGKITARKVVNAICILILSTMLITSVVAYAALQGILNSSDYISGIANLSSTNSTRIYDRDNNLITTLAGTDGFRENITYEQVPQSVIDAFLSIEDSRFFTHNGFDLARFVASGINNVRSGSFSQGGSTLTMQLIDVSSQNNKTLLSTQDKLEDKVREIFKSMEIETELTKDQIIENYLNKINFGGSARGIQKGSQLYFGKNVEDLNLSEAAFLAGVINAPSTNYPYRDGFIKDSSGNPTTATYYQAALERRNTTLYQMLNHGYISQEEYDLAKSTVLAFQLNGEKDFATEKYQGFIDYAILEVQEKTGLNPYTTPMDIYTTMDSKAQERSDELSDGDNGNVPYLNDRFQVGFSAINNQTGEIVALGQGRNYQSGPEAIMRATMATHQPGSTSKPITEYVQAFEYLGYSTEFVLEDGPKVYGTGVMPNASQTFAGDVTLKTAIGLSLNTPAYETLQKVVAKIGTDKEIELLNKMGLKVESDKFDLGYSIGGSNYEVTPLQLAGAYTIFANKGQYIEPYSVSKVSFQDHSRDDYVASQEKQTVVSEGSAWLMSYMLRDVVETPYGTLANYLKSDYPVYAKSGTTDYGDSGELFGYPNNIAKDKWMAAYTSQYTVTCWAGYDGGVIGEHNYLEGDELYANVEGVITKELLSTLSEGKDVKEIPMPSDVSKISHIQGLYPYATAGSGGKMVTGYILNKYASNIKQLEPDALSKPTTMTATSKDGAVSFDIAAYPDPSKLVVASNIKTMTANGTTATGLRMFDKSFVFGVVTYNYELFLNDKLVTSAKLDSTKGTYTLDAKDTDTIKVCGYYGYSGASLKSETTCATVKGSTSNPVFKYTVGTDFDQLFQGLAYDKTKSDVQAWMTIHMPEIKYTISENKDLAQGTLDSKTTIVSGTEVTSEKTYVIIIGSKSATTETPTN